MSTSELSDSDLTGTAESGHSTVKQLLANNAHFQSFLPTGQAGSGLKRESATQQIPFYGQDFDSESKFIAILRNPYLTLLPQLYCKK